MKGSSSAADYDVILIGTGFGALSAAAALTAYNFRPLLLESHYAPGGVAHGFDVTTPQGLFHFDTGPSFFCSLTTKASLNPLKHALDAVDEKVDCVSYDRFCIDDLKVGTVHICDDQAETLESIESVGGRKARMEMARFYGVMERVCRGMNVPAVALRGDWRLAPVIASRWSKSLLDLLPYVGDVKKPIGYIMDRIGVRDEFVKRILDTETFLLSGLKADATITAEIAFMVGERFKKNAMEYPIGGARSIVQAFVRGIERKGGKVRTRAHVNKILVENGKAQGVELKNGERIRAKWVFSNASMWDTVKLLDGYLPESYKKNVMSTPVVESFMHAHMAIRAEGLVDVIGHHAVIIDSDRDIAEPGNTVMISIPTLWSPEMAPEGWHIIHAYTLEPFEKWPALHKDRKAYQEAKRKAAEPLFTAVRHVIPDLDERLQADDAFVKIGSPVTHARFNRRYKGTYGAAIRAGDAEFEWPSDIPVEGLKRCSDSTFPGIGVPSSAAAGLIAANELVGVREHIELIEKVFPK